MSKECQMLQYKNRFLYIAFLIATEQVITDPYQVRGKIGRNPEKYWIPGQARNDKNEKTNAGGHKFLTIGPFGFYLNLEL